MSEPFLCSWCYMSERRKLDSWKENLPTDVLKALPVATKYYAPSCKCGQGCGDEYLCDACAATVENQLYIEDLDDD